jgi:hypothetical protein
MQGEAGQPSVSKRLQALVGAGAGKILSMLQSNGPEEQQRGET